MAILDWVIIAGIAIVVVFLLFDSFFLIQYMNNKKALSKLEAKRSKNKRKEKSKRRKIKELKQIQSGKVKTMVIVLILALLFGAGTGYAKFYQSTNLSETDSENVVYGYYLLNQMSEQLANGKDIQDKKRDKNIHELAIQMSSYASKKGSDRGTQEAQILLNRYYSRLGQLGINLAASKFVEFEATENIRNEYLADIKKVQTYQKKVLQYYKVNEELLKQKN